MTFKAAPWCGFWTEIQIQTQYNLNVLIDACLQQRPLSVYRELCMLYGHIPKAVKYSSEKKQQRYTSLW